MDFGSILLTIISSVFSVWTSFYFASLQIDKKLDRLIHREYDGVLTGPQAEALVELYLEMIKKALQWKIDDFCNYHLNSLSAETPIEILRGRLDHEIKASFEFERNNVGQRFSTFKISKNRSFKEFLDEVDRSELPSASEEFMKAVLAYLNADHKGRSAKLEALRFYLATRMAERNGKGKAIMLDHIRHWYKSNSLSK